MRNAIPFLLIVLAPSFGFAQASSTTSPVTGDIRPITLQSRGTETNVLFADIAAGAAADDNNNNSFSHPIGGAQYFADPSVAIQETRSHLAWDLSYHPMVRFYVPSSSHPDVFSQTVGGTLRYDLTKRLAIGVRQDYLRTFDPFQQLGDTPLQPGIGLGNRPGVVPLDNFRRTELLSQAEVDYRLTKHTSLGLSGDFIQVYGDELGGKHTSLIRTNDTLGSAFVAHQISARQTVGLQYEFLDIVFPGRDTRTQTHGGLVFDQIAINAHTSFALFGGPEYSRIHNQLILDVLGVVFKIPASSTLWSPSAGAILDWRRDRLGIQASFVRRISDGGGLQGAVDMNDAVLRLKTKLARRWVADLDGEFTQRTLLNEPTIGKLQVLHLGAGIGHELAHKLWIRALYQRLNNIDESHSTLQFGNHNRVTLSLERDFAMPIGR